MSTKSLQIVLFGIGLSILGTAAESATLNHHFWPGPIVQEDLDASGSLYAWPDYAVLLQNKSAQGLYTPAVISDSLAEELTSTFKAASPSPIVVVRDPVAKSWGLSIPGGSSLAPGNAVLVDAMNNGFVACLATLTSDELDRMKEVIYTPGTLVSSTGQPGFDAEHKRIAAKMYESYKTNRCENGATLVPGLVKQTHRRYLLTLLTGAPDASVNAGVQLVLTSLYKDLYFASKGLWVRVTLAELQKFISETLVKYPIPANTDWLERDYNSFVDFVLLSRDGSGLSKDQYLKVAGACGVDQVGKIFGTFPLKQCSSRGQVNLLHLYLNTTEGVLLLAGARS